MKKGLFSLTNLSLRKKKDFDKIYQEGKKKFFNFYAVCYVLAEKPKVGFSVSSKFGKAVYRNRRKRVLREYFRKELLKLPPYFFIFTLLKKISNETEEKKEIEKIFEWIKSLKS